MPNKRVSDIKDTPSKTAAIEWSRKLGISDLTTREWDYAASLASRGYEDAEIRKKILSERK
jgi:hypothetical protein